MPEVFAGLFALMVVGMVWLVAPPVVAWLKGYPWVPWCFACGVLGVAVLAVFPRLHRVEGEEDKSRFLQWADRLGWTLSLFGLACLVVFDSVVSPKHLRWWG